jgi:hypothetical protein
MDPVFFMAGMKQNYAAMVHGHEKTPHEAGF